MTERAKSSHEPASAKESIVFVIDDDVAMRTTLSSLFRSVGLRVELFGSPIVLRGSQNAVRLFSVKRRNKRRPQSRICQQETSATRYERSPPT